MHREPLDRPSPSPALHEASTTEAPSVTRRRGGREARRELRAKPIPSEKMAVRPGLPSGRYRPLTAAEVERIHGAALDVLEQVGLSDAIPSCIDLVTEAGGLFGGDGRLRFPRALVEDTIARAARRFVLHAADPRCDLEPWGARVHFPRPAPRCTSWMWRPGPIATRRSPTCTTSPGWSIASITFTCSSALW